MSILAIYDLVLTNKKLVWEEDPRVPIIFESKSRSMVLVMIRRLLLARHGHQQVQLN